MRNQLRFLSTITESFAAWCKAMSITVSPGLPVQGKYLMAKPMGFADQCKPSFARPASEAKTTWYLLLLLLLRGGGGEKGTLGKRIHLPIYFPNGKSLATKHRRCDAFSKLERWKFIYFTKEIATDLSSFDISTSIRIYCRFDENFTSIYR